MNILDIILENGNAIYAIAFVWAFFEGEIFVLFAGAAAAQGLLNPVLLVAVAAIGSFSGDQCWFFFGRRYGRALLRRFVRWRPRVEAVLDWVTEYDFLFIIGYRFVYGIRNISSFALGLSAVPSHRFMALNIVGSALWSASFVAIGYLFGELLGRALGGLAWDLALATTAGLALAVLLGRTLERRAKRRAHHAEGPIPRDPAPPSTGPTGEIQEIQRDPGLW